ncbi:MAG: hypothetical protein PHI12_11650 [Dehalococcoidales bacterium]|nr:hypothetical protein [Dehalococcoidales bacterium]
MPGRHNPERYSDGTGRPPREQEDRIAGRLGGVRVRGSGASQYSKGDVRNVSVDDLKFLVECKQTQKASISIKWSWLKKIMAEADAKQCEPAVAIEIQGGEDDPRTDRDWILVPARVWEKMRCRND